MSITYGAISEDDRVATAARTITEADVVAFAGLSGDFNPLHMDEEWAREHTPYGGRIAHGLLGLAITSGLRSVYDDWEVLAYLECTRRFVAPLLIGDTVHAEYVVTGKKDSSSYPGGGVVTLSVDVRDQKGELVQTGHDVVLVAGAESR